MVLERLLPDADLLVKRLLRQALGPGVTVQTQLTNVFTRLPYVFVNAGGGSEPHPELLGLPLVDLECYAGPSKKDALDLAEGARVALWRAVDQQIVVPGVGHLTSYRLVNPFREERLRGQPPDVYRIPGTLALGVRS